MNNNCIFHLKIRELKTDDFNYTFLLNKDDVLTLSGLPFKKRGSDEPSKTTLNCGEIDVYRYDNELTLFYDNSNSEKRRHVKINIDFNSFETSLSTIYQQMDKGINQELLLDVTLI